MQLKTGLIITASKTNGELNNFSVTRITSSPTAEDEWEQQEPEFNIKECNDYINLLCEGLGTVIQHAENLKLASGPEMLRLVISRIEDSYTTASKLNISDNTSEIYKTK